MGGKSEQGLHKGRRPGCKNRLTRETLALAEGGETPCAFALRIMRDEQQALELRLNAARIAAPYLHPKPQPEGRIVAFDLPEEIGTATALASFHVILLRAVGSGELALDEARDIITIIESHRRMIETVELEERLSRLEKTMSHG
jgi:hypothetical protein